MDGDGPDVFDRTVDWAVGQGIETATFHIMTPYPGTGLYQRMRAEGRIRHDDWDAYDTRHVVFEPRGMTEAQLTAGYRRAYRDFYRWSALWRGAATKPVFRDRLRHLAYAGGWKKFEPVWDVLIRSHHVLRALPLLEAALGSFGARTPTLSRPSQSHPGPVNTCPSTVDYRADRRRPGGTPAGHPGPCPTTGACPGAGGTRRGMR
jgi:hypothetical protein